MSFVGEIQRRKVFQVAAVVILVLAIGWRRSARILNAPGEPPYLS